MYFSIRNHINLLVSLNQLKFSFCYFVYSIIEMCCVPRSFRMLNVKCICIYEFQHLITIVA